MKRFVIAVVLILAVLGGSFFFWMRSGGGAVVDLSDEQMEEARLSGEGSKEIAVETAPEAAPLPTLEQLKVVVDRAELDGMGEAVASARAQLDPLSQDEDRALLTSLLAEVRRLQRRVDEAQVLAREAAEALPTNSRVRLIYAYTIRSKIVEEADGGSKLALLRQLVPVRQYKAELEAAVELDPSNVDARVAQIMVLGLTPSPIGDQEEAKQLIEELGQYDPFRRDFWRAQLLSAEKKKDEALAAVRKLEQLQPEDLDVQYTIGDLIYKRKDWRGAAAVFDRIAVEPWTRQGYQALYQAAKCREKAEYELERSFAMLEHLERADPVGELMPSMDRLKYHQGVVLRKLGRLEEALVCFRAAEELKPKEKRFQDAVAETAGLIDGASR